MPDVVQFIHPGGEHGQDAPGHKAWNVRDHRRKFLHARGRFAADSAGVEREDELFFWGEWEPESDVQSLRTNTEGAPRWLHTPYYARPNSYRREGKILQNTDPFVFGDRFLYTLCRQWRPATNSPTLLRDLTPGSLILFGSLKRGEFVLDTVFVVAEGALHDRNSWQRKLRDRVSQTYVDVTLRPTYEPTADPELRLYFGATFAEQVGGMFSFVPCRPAEGGTTAFARPAIQLDGFITPNLMMGFKASRGVSTSALGSYGMRLLSRSSPMGWP